MTNIEEINKAIALLSEEEKGEVSDGYHTFKEVYDHRCVLYVQLCNFVKTSLPLLYRVWASKKHHDGSSFDNWFIMGIVMKDGKQISYHLPMAYWDFVSLFAEILDEGLERDGHTSQDVLERLLKL